MCGIAGIFDLKSTRDIDRDALRRMTSALKHRGPDGEGFYIAPGIGFGHRRLAIIDRDGGAQPFHAQTNSCVLSFNGEIYNYTSLAKELSHKVRLKTRSDTEALAEGLAVGGLQFIHDLQGMYAFSFWDPSKNLLLLARDRLGERPLYYAETSDGFLLFASELGALIASELIETSLDPRAISDYFFYGYVPDPKTIYRGVYKLPAGHAISVKRSGAVRPERYWRPVFASGARIDFDDAAGALREKLDQAVKAQMMSDVPLGAFLSGGVDSASIVSSMAQTGGELIACTVGFDVAGHDERAPASEIAQKFNATHYQDVAACDDFNLIDTLAATFGEPFADASALPSYIVSRITRQHVTVALSGDGGDEIFAGYRRYPFYLNEEKIRRLAPLTIRRALFGTAGALYPKLDWAPQLIRLKSTFQALGQSSAAGYASAVAINFPGRISGMLNKEFVRSLSGYTSQSVIEDAMNEANSDDPLARAQYADLTTWLPGRMLTKVDRTSMAHGLEVRPPLLNHSLVEWAGLMPGEFKLKGGEQKRLLKAAFSTRLGADYVNRKKQGFAPPLSQWMRRSGQNPLSRLETSRAWRECGIFNEHGIEKMMRAHQNGVADCAQELWSVIMFDAFLRNTHS
ncbi:asparagine synthase (glutamine-hydrolyzing) [Hyphococcus flavus]|uniref:asparagine synthase (glutamine-hydrolyzing) n=1 Tax=Hyphococcus flavus TaxID=1866326 RepID=A0AAE9ZD52_9PROT|nr:asparagine synthase (glutamine-hydrolyzing) [Hyphococcus flavus]WDI31370.1 asparagine synthase (glutamine-hydrolyzing) [Hyphococcus flavus]